MFDTTVMLLYRHTTQESRVMHASHRAKRTLEGAERQAQEKAAPAGYRRGRDMMQEGIATHFQPLKQWLSDYEAMREQVFQDTAVRLPNLGHLYLSERGIDDFIEGIFSQNRFGDDCIAQHRRE
jgi:hypothetical protein